MDHPLATFDNRSCRQIGVPETADESLNERRDAAGSISARNVRRAQLICGSALSTTESTSSLKNSSKPPGEISSTGGLVAGIPDVCTVASLKSDHRGRRPAPPTQGRRRVPPDEAVLVLARVAMRGAARSRADIGVLNERNPPRVPHRRS